MDRFMSIKHNKKTHEGIVSIARTMFYDLTVKNTREKHTENIKDFVLPLGFAASLFVR